MNPIPALKFIVIDDEPLARELIHDYLKATEGVESVFLFGNAQDALDFLNTSHADILLLDIEMPDMTGIEFLDKLRDPPLTIFTTAYRDYALEGFELGVIDFLLKPISFQRFTAAIEKVRDFLTLKSHDAKLESDKQSGEFIVVKSGLKRIRLQVDQITHIQGLKDYTIIYTPHEKIVVKGSVKIAQEMFHPSIFVRVHKSFLVSANKIRRIERNKIIMDNFQIPIGRIYKEEVERKLRMES